MSPLLISLLRCLRNQHVFNLRKNTTWKYHEGLSPSHYHVCDCVLEWVSNIHLYLVKQKTFLNWNWIELTNSGSGIKWAECLRIIRMAFRVKVFDLILRRSDGLRVGIQSAGNSAPDTPPSFESWSHQRKTTCLLLMCRSIKMKATYIWYA